jgi:hypothetical protein
MADGVVYCNRCGSQSAASARFCVNCGTGFPGYAEAAPAEIPPSQSQFQSQTWQPTPVSYAAPLPSIRYAGFWIRFVAALIDALIVGVVVWPVTAIIALTI